jgi:hypothetical protein
MLAQPLAITFGMRRSDQSISFQSAYKGSRGKTGSDPQSAQLHGFRQESNYNSRFTTFPHDYHACQRS